MHKQLMRVWESAIRLYDYSKVKECLKSELGNADLRLGIYVFLAAGLISAGLTVAGAAVALYMGAYTYETLSQIADIGQVDVNWGVLVPVSLYQLLLIPFMLVIGLCHEGAAFKLFRLTGGKGTFARQFYLSSLVMLSLAFASALSILISMPFLLVLAVLALLGLALYFVFYVNVKAYEMVHDISGLHAFMIVALLAIPRILLMVLATNIAGNIVGIPQLVPYEITGV